MEQEPAGEDADNRREGKMPRRDGRADEALLPATLNGGALAIPSAGEMSVLLDRVDNVDDMKNLHEAAAAWEATTKRMKRAFEEIAAIAEFRIRLERKIGQHLSQTVKRGRPTKRFDSRTFSDEAASTGLPEHISKATANGYRKLAAIPEDQLDAYLARARAAERVPSSRGLIKFAAGSCQATSSFAS